jgi:Fic family protein
MPRRAPSLDALYKHFLSSRSSYKLPAAVPGPLVRGRYVHWDKLRHLTPPEGYDHEEWWYALKLHRLNSRAIPLEDKSGDNFSFNLVDPLPECLHHVDSMARGIIRQLEPVTNPETRDAFLVSSLIEESITSSQLEGASTTQAVANRMIREGRDPRDRSERMILNNYRTMQHILEIKDQEMSRDLIFEIHRMVTDGTLDKPSGAGRFRLPEEEVIVGDNLGEVFHIPPPAVELDRRWDALCAFANGATPEGFIHPLVRSMILHFWLAYDHPFVDGNGRTARALFYWSMLKHGYWLFEFITISKIILKGPAKYGRAFLYTETDDNDLTYFLLYHAEIVRRAIEEMHAYIERHTQRLATAQRDLQGLTILNHRQRDLISHALRHSGQQYTVEYHRSSHNVVYETARTDMMDLVDRGLMVKRKIGKTWHFTPAPDLEARLRGPA